MSADKLASFRVDSQLWEQFQTYARENNATATALLTNYIKSVVNTGNVNTSNPVVNTSNVNTNHSLSIQDIDKRIDNKIEKSIQAINTISIDKIEDLIDARIAGSTREGDIHNAIATSYVATMGQFNGLLEELQALKIKVEELEADKKKALADKEKLIDKLGIRDIVEGAVYYQQLLIDRGLEQLIDQSSKELKSAGIVLEKRHNTITKKTNYILERLGCNPKNDGQKTIDGRSGIETYKVQI